MHLTVHQKSFDGNRPVYIVAQDVQAIEYGADSTILRLIGGNIIPCEESPKEILEFLQVYLPERWA